MNRKLKYSKVSFFN